MSDELISVVIVVLVVGATFRMPMTIGGCGV